MTISKGHNSMHSKTFLKIQNISLKANSQLWNHPELYVSTKILCQQQSNFPRFLLIFPSFDVAIAWFYRNFLRFTYFSGAKIQ